MQATAHAYLVDSLHRAVGVDRLGVLTLKPEQHRAVRAVPVAGGPEGPVELGLDPGRRVEHAQLAESHGEPTSRPHRADGV